jgi:hypothetical protein
MLTNMATLLKLINENQLVPIEIELDSNVMEARFLYLLPSAVERFDKMLKTAESN